MSSIGIKMKNYLFLLFLLFLSACGSFARPRQVGVSYYTCENDRSIIVKHSEDYQTLALSYNLGRQVLLHHFVSTRGSGYQSENLLWIVKDKEAILIEKLANGSEKFLFKECKLERYN
jgi:membrane-bound inhibitor of C-type lysozyme